MHLHAIKVKFHGPTNSSGSRVSFTSLRFGDRRMTSLPCELSMVDYMVKFLESEGYQDLATAETPDGYLVLTSTFEPLTTKNRREKAARIAAIGL